MPERLAGQFANAWYAHEVAVPSWLFTLVFSAIVYGLAFVVIDLIRHWKDD